MNSFLNHRQTPGNAWKGGEGEEELVGGNEKKGRDGRRGQGEGMDRSCLLVGMKGKVQRRRRKEKVKPKGSKHRRNSKKDKSEKFAFHPLINSKNHCSLCN